MLNLVRGPTEIRHWSSAGGPEEDGDEEDCWGLGGGGDGGDGKDAAAVS